MMATNSNMDIANTQKIIKNLFPNFKVTRQQLLKPTPDFVFDFYSHFLYEAYQTLSLFTNNEVVEEKSDLFLKEASRFRNIVNYFNNVPLEITLFDLCNPKPKRTHTLMKYALNYILYLFNNVDEMLEVHRAAATKADLKNILYQRTQHTLEELAEYTEAMACEESKVKSLEKELSELHLTREQMNLDKSEKQIRQEKLLKKKEALERELECLEVNLNVGKDIEQKIEQKVVPEKEYERLKAVKECLNQEAESISFNNQQDLNIKSDELEMFSNAANKFRNVSFHSLPTKQTQELQEVQLKLINEIHSLNVKYTSLKAEQEKILETIKNQEQDYLDYKSEYNEVYNILGLLDSVLTNLKAKGLEINSLKATLTKNIHKHREQRKNLIEKFL